MSQYQQQEEIRKQLSAISKKEMKDLTKEAVKELVAEHVAMFGWWSLKTLGVIAMGGIVFFSIYFERWPK